MITKKKRLIPGLDMSRDQLKADIVDLNPFSLLEALQAYAKIYAEDGSEVIDLSRGSPSHIYSRSSAEGQEIIGYVRAAVNNLTKKDLREIARPKKLTSKTIEDKLKVAAGLVERSELIDRASRNLHEVIHYLVDRSGVKTGRDEFTAELLRETIAHSSGIPYGSKKGLSLAKLYFRDIFSQAGLEERIDEGLPHEHILITQGVSQGIDTFFSSGHFNRGDYVIAITPFYPPYQRQAEMHGLKMIPIPSDSQGSLDLDVIKALKEDIKRLPFAERLKIKSLVIIDPSNPTGHTLTTNEKKILAGLSEVSVAPNLIIAEDNVYRLYSDNFRFIHQINPDAPVIYFYSVSKAEKSAGKRVGAMYVNKEAEKRLSGVLRNSAGARVRAYEYFAELKGGTSQHTNQAATLAQLDAVFCGTYDRLHNHVSAFNKQITRTRKNAFEMFGISTQRRINGSNYYFWLNVHDYVSSQLKPKDKKRRDILQNLDVPEIILRLIERHGIVLFGGSSFYPQTDIPGILQGTEYSRLYHQKSKYRPEHFIRASLPNTDSDTFLYAMGKLKETIDEHILELRNGKYKPKKRETKAIDQGLDTNRFMDYVRKRLLEAGFDKKDFRREYRNWTDEPIESKLPRERGDTRDIPNIGGILLEDIVELHKTPKGQLFRVRFGIKQKTVSDADDSGTLTDASLSFKPDGKPLAYIQLEGLSPLNGRRWEYLISTGNFKSVTKMHLTFDPFDPPLYTNVFSRVESLRFEDMKLTFDALLDFVIQQHQLGQYIYFDDHVKEEGARRKEVSHKCYDNLLALEQRSGKIMDASYSTGKDNSPNLTITLNVGGIKHKSIVYFRNPYVIEQILDPSLVGLKNRIGSISDLVNQSVTAFLYNGTVVALSPNYDNKTR